MPTRTRESTLEERFKQQLWLDLQNPEYLKEWLVYDLSEQILAVLSQEGLSRADLAARLGVSRQYVTKLINRTPNLTLRSLAEIAAALGRQVTVRLEPLPVSAPAAEIKREREEKPAHAGASRRGDSSRQRSAVVSSP
jgi:transcriptional regulator with XRE-family HTH domain